MDHIDRRVLLGAAGLVGVAALASRGQGGPLNPPGGAVASTGKPLGEVEPRVAINATNTPGDADSVFKITQSGSYYLTGNVQGVANRYGIEVAADNVTIDLNGFSMIGVTNARDAVRGDGGPLLSGLTVRNGAVRGWGNGSGVFAAGMADCVVENVRFETMGFEGVWLGARARVIGCWSRGTRSGLRAGADSWFERCRVEVASENGVLGGAGCTVRMCEVVLSGLVSVQLGDRATVEGCRVFNSFSTGVQVGPTSRVEGCEVRTVSSVGVACGVQCVVRGCGVWDAGAIGVTVQQDGVVDRCMVNNAGDAGVRCFAGGTVRETEVYNCTAYGINCDSNCTVRGCKCVGNGGGIRADGGSHVVGCVCINNSTVASAPGISIFGLRGRVEGNQCVGNQIGITTSAGTLVVGNTCGGNLVMNWGLAAGTVYGPIIDRTAPGTPAGTGNSAADATGTTHPWANFTH